MQIIISPAMKMATTEAFRPQTRPKFRQAAGQLVNFLQQQSPAQLAQIWHASEAITQLSYEQLQQLDFKHQLVAAAFSYQGIQYQYMAPDVMTQPALDFLQEHVRILSGLYGVLRPFDGVQPYRLEMKHRLAGFGDGSLYHFWGSQLAHSLFQESATVINLASREYAKAITPYVATSQRFVTINFQEWTKDKWKTVGVHAKMARGAMTKLICEQQLDTPESLQAFNDLGFKFVPEASSPNTYLFRTTDYGQQ